MEDAVRSSSRPTERIQVDEETITSNRMRFSRSKAEKAIATAKVCEGVNVNVVYTHSKNMETLLGFIQEIKDRQGEEPFLFAIYRAPPYKDDSTWPLVVSASSSALLRRVALLTHTRFIKRVQSSSEIKDDSWKWEAQIVASNRSQEDEDMLWEILRCTPSAIAPPGSRSSDELNSAARAQLRRVTVERTHQELQKNQDTSTSHAVHLVDVRTAEQRGEHGTIPGAQHVERINLEEFFDKKIHNDNQEEAVRYDSRVIIFDQDGNASARAAIVLHEMGLVNATDMIGGFAAWKEAGFSVCLDLMTFPGSICD